MRIYVDIYIYKYLNNTQFLDIQPHSMCAIHQAGELEKRLLTYKVKRRIDANFCGLIVKDKFARRFVDGDPSERKVLEIRSKPCRFLQEGERICLLSSNRSTKRMVLGVLEFCDCTKIAVKQLNRYYNLHRISPDELVEFGKSFKKGTTHVYGYNFRLVAAFDPALELYFTKCEVWCWFPAQCLATPPQDTPTNRLLRLESSATQDSFSAAPSVKRKLSFHEPDCDSIVQEAESSESVKRQNKSVSVSDAREVDDSSGRREEEEDEEQEIEPEDEEEHAKEEFETTKRPPNTWICCVLSPKEWEYVSQGHCKHLLRPWGTAKQDLCVLVERDVGVSMCGVITVDKADRACEASFKATASLYNPKQMKVIEEQKSCYAWEVLRLEAFQEEIVTGCLEIPLRFKGRPFPVPIGDLKARPLNYPTSLNLKETGKYFLSCMKPDMLEGLKRTVDSLCRGKAVVRIGTTCSGTDICVRVVQQTFAMLQEQFQKQGITVEHTFSCEKDPRKRSIMLLGHSPKHCFGDTDDFRVGRGYCYVTNKVVPINQETCGIDILLSGPVCKDLSLLNRKRKMSAGCYEKGFEAEGQDGAGVSGQTYETGFRKAWQDIVCPHF